MWVKQCHKPSPRHHHFYRWYSNHSQSWVVNNYFSHISQFMSVYCSHPISPCFVHKSRHTPTETLLEWKMGWTNCWATFKDESLLWTIPMGILLQTLAPRPRSNQINPPSGDIIIFLGLFSLCLNE